MAPKRKKIGRLPGLKNKKRKMSHKNVVKNNAFGDVILKKEKDIVPSAEVEYVCNVCNKNFKTGKALLIHHKRCRSLEYSDVVLPKVNNVYYLTYITLHQ